MIALSRSGPRSVQAFDLKKASACSRLSHSVIATRLGGGGPSKPTTFPLLLWARNSPRVTRPGWQQHRTQAGACSPRSRTKTRNRAAPYLVRWAAADVTDCSCHSPRRQQLKNTVTRCRGCECEVVHTSRQFGPLKSAIGHLSGARRGAWHQNPKPARFVFTVGMALAMALTILAITADRDLAATKGSASSPAD